MRVLIHILIICFFNLDVSFGQFNKLSQFNTFYINTDPNLKRVSDPELISKARGLVIAIDSSKTPFTNTSFCATYDTANRAAIIICNKLGYTGNGKSYPLIYSTKDNAKRDTKYKIDACSDTDCDLVDASTDLYCKDNRGDLYVFCTNNYVYNTTEICKTSLECTLEYNNSTNLITIRNNVDKKSYPLCGRKRNFGTQEAELFCRLLNIPTNYSRIIESIGYTGPNVGGFIDMSCKSNATELSQCSKIEPFNKEGCVPQDSIGLLCSNTNTVLDPQPPILSCNSTYATVAWNRTSQTTLKDADIKIVTQSSCSPIYSSNNAEIKMDVKLNDCGIIATSNKDYLHYTFLVNRTYNLQNRNDDLFNLTCLLPRFTNASEGPFTVQDSQINPGDGTIKNPISLLLYTDKEYTNQIPNLSLISKGSTIFVKLTFTNPSPNVALVITDCKVTIANVDYQLITSRCPEAKYSVSINPISRISMGFSYITFTDLGNEAIITCSTTTCIESDTACPRTC